MSQSYDYWYGKNKWKLDRFMEDASIEPRIFTDTIQDTRIKLDTNLGVDILWKDYCSECSSVSGFIELGSTQLHSLGPQCLQVTFKGKVFVYKSCTETEKSSLK